MIENAQALSFARVFSSPLLRTRCTAELAIAEKLKADIKIECPGWSLHHDGTLPQLFAWNDWHSGESPHGRAVGAKLAFGAQEAR